jgi:hypothetical protein
MRHLSRRFLLALVLGLALGAAGCGSRSEPAATQAKPTVVMKKAASPADAISPYMVGAVATVKPGAGLLQLKFDLGGRPEVGEAVDVDLIIVPVGDNVDEFSGTIAADDGLEVVSGADIPATAKPVAGTPIHHSFKVRAKRDGIFTLNASMTVESGGQSLGPVYSMPIIAGNGLGDSGAAAVPRASRTKPAPTAAAQ